jgi:peptidoglycan/LPS O-acetylase OafA/YrhL
VVRGTRLSARRRWRRALPQSSQAQNPGFRPDIQGLRAVAVLLVVLNHAGVPLLGGGYVGVDVFFVISGFLITGWLLRRTERNGRVPFAKFYASRARRILPAATLVLVVTAIASRYLLNYVRALSALHDCIWAAFFAANIHFTQVGTDYFAANSPPSPVQQFWTLAVEEQFYVVWPALLALGLLVVGPGRRARRTVPVDRAAMRRMSILVAIFVLASFAWSVWDTPREPTAAYLSTLTRAWELGVGVLVALTASRLACLPSRIRLLMGWAGLFGIVIAGNVFTSQTEYPGYAALLPVLATALVITGGLGNPVRGAVGAFLGCQPLRLTGDASYSLYLWHWPILIIAAEYEGHTLSVAANLLLLAGAFGLSVVTYYLFEDPIRHSEFLMPSLKALSVWPLTVSVTVGVASLGIIAIQQGLADQLTSALASRSDAIDFTYHNTTNPTTENGSSHTRTTGPVRQPTTRTPYTDAVAASVSPARRAMSVPYALSPLVQDLPHDGYPLGSCEAPIGGATRTPICRLGDASSNRTIVVFGDSHAQMWMPGIIYAAEQHKLAVIPILKEGCTAGTWLSDPKGDACRGWNIWALQQLKHIRPTAIIVGESYSSFLLSGSDLSNWAELGLAREVIALRRLSATVILVEDAPALPKNPVDCLLAGGATLGSCTFSIGDRLTRANSQIVGITTTNNARFLRTLQWFCAGAQCPTVIGTTIGYWDQYHVSNTYATKLRMPFAEEIAGFLSPRSS